MDPIVGQLLASLATVIVKVLGALALYLDGRHDQAAKDHAAGLELVTKAWKDLADSRRQPASAPELRVQDGASTLGEASTAGDPGGVSSAGQAKEVRLPSQHSDR